MTTLLAARNLSAGYGAIPVLTDLDLHVDSSEIVALMGSNGAGKTTTLMALCGRLQASAGTVEWLGRPVRSGLHRRPRAGLRYVSEERSIIRLSPRSTTSGSAPARSTTRSSASPS